VWLASSSKIFRRFLRQRKPKTAKTQDQHDYPSNNPPFLKTTEIGPIRRGSTHSIFKYSAFSKTAETAALVRRDGQSEFHSNTPSFLRQRKLGMAFSPASADPVLQIFRRF
jgi:hypothetical protein